MRLYACDSLNSLALYSVSLRFPVDDDDGRSVNYLDVFSFARSPGFLHGDYDGFPLALALARTHIHASTRYRPEVDVILLPNFPSDFFFFHSFSRTAL